MFKCEDCGDVKMVTLDGYAIGDRLLEGVMFNITKRKNGTFKAVFAEPDSRYVQGLNKRKWEKDMAEYAAETDVFACGTCGGDIYVEEDSDVNPVSGKPLTLINCADIRAAFVKKVT